jgi:hypothetical protein
MARFLPHPGDVPVQLTLGDQPDISRGRLHTISLGGVACQSPRAWRCGTALQMRIPSLGPLACYPGFVAWCLKRKQGYLVGIAFTDEQTLFGARMVEQVCRIERHCQQLANTCEPGALALEWVEQHAAEFSHEQVNRLFRRQGAD